MWSNPDLVISTEGILNEKLSFLCSGIEIFKNAGFKIWKTNLHFADSLHVIFNLLDETYRPDKKPNGQLLYVNTSWKHPPQIIKQLPTYISNCSLNKYSTKQVFHMSKAEYEEALRESGY